MRSSETPNPRPFRRRRGHLTAVALMTAAFAASLAAIALASAGAPTVKAAHNAKLGRIVVDAHGGRTLYVLTPETARHLLCKTRECFEIWPPLTVPSRKTKLKAGAGVHGRLTILRRGKGMLQVMLNGMPLYRFAGDSRKGEAKGQHIHSFGGVWHVVSASRHNKSMSSSGTSSTSTGTTMTSSTGWPSSSSTASTTSSMPSTTSTTSMTSTTTTTTTTTTTCKPPYCY